MVRKGLDLVHTLDHPCPREGEFLLVIMSTISLPTGIVIEGDPHGLLPPELYTDVPSFDTSNRRLVIVVSFIGSKTWCARTTIRKWCKEVRRWCAACH